MDLNPELLSAIDRLCVGLVVQCMFQCRVHNLNLRAVTLEMAMRITTCAATLRPPHHRPDLAALRSVATPGVVVQALLVLVLALVPFPFALHRVGVDVNGLALCARRR